MLRYFSAISFHLVPLSFAFQAIVDFNASNDDTIKLRIQQINVINECIYLACRLQSSSVCLVILTRSCLTQCHACRMKDFELCHSRRFECPHPTVCTNRFCLFTSWTRVSHSRASHVGKFREEIISGNERKQNWLCGERFGCSTVMETFEQFPGWMKD